MNDLLLELVKIGFHGAAIAMAILTYKLLGKALAMWGPNVNPSAGEILSKLLGEIRVFMGVCIVLFSVGVLAQLYAPPTKTPIASIMISPETWPKSIQEMGKHVFIKHEQNQIEMAGGLARININDKDTIRFVINDLVYEIELLDRNYKTLLTQRTPGGGFGE